MMDINDIKHLAVERIWLLPGEYDGEQCLVWCDCPAPGEGMDESEAVAYVRTDIHEQRIAELEQERDALAAHVERLSDLVRDNMESDNHFLTEWDKLARKAITELPKISLHRRDALKQAEALEKVSRAVKEKGVSTLTVAAIDYIAAEWRAGRKTRVDQIGKERLAEAQQ